MKKTLLFLFLSVLLFQASANITTSGYRWRNDNGSEAGATWKSSENGSISNVTKSGNLRVRFNIIGENDPDYGPVTTSFSLWYDELIDGQTVTSTEVTNSPNAAFMMAGSSPYVTDGQITTSQMAGSQTYNAGKVITTAKSTTITLGYGNRTEYEYVIKAGNTIKKNASYVFYTSGTIPMYSTSTPSLTTSATLPLKLLSFEAQQLEKSIELRWVAEQQIDVNQFIIEKSGDRGNFSSIGSVQAGTGSKKYSFTDNSPFTANNYYRLKIVENDGSFSYSNISRVSNSNNKNSISIFPNPAKDKLNISLTANAGPVVIALRDVTGRTIKTFTANSDGSTMNEVADISSLQRGIYFVSFNKQTVRFMKD